MLKKINLCPYSLDGWHILDKKNLPIIFDISPCKQRYNKTGVVEI